MRSTKSVISCPAPERLGLHSQSYPLFIGETKPLSFELLLAHTVLFDAVVDDHLLVAVEPTPRNLPFTGIPSSSDLQKLSFRKDNLRSDDADQSKHRPVNRHASTGVNFRWSGTPGYKCDQLPG